MQMPSASELSGTVRIASALPCTSKCMLFNHRVVLSLHAAQAHTSCLGQRS